MKKSVTKATRKLLRSYGPNTYSHDLTHGAPECLTWIPDLPTKISGTTISRLLKGQAMGCTYCFPHSYETTNSKWTKDLKCWKRYRKTQYRPK